MLLAAFACASALALRPADAASSNVVVSMDVPSAVTFANSCTETTATSLGVVQPDTAATTATGAGACQISWSSSNDTSRLRIFQSDRTGVAMAKPANSWNNGRSSAALMALGIHAYDANTVMMVSEGGTVVRTIDGGATWVSNAIGTTQWLFDAEPAPGAPNTWVVVGGDGVVRSTTNAITSMPGAATWTSHDAALLAAGWPATEEVLGVAVVDASTWMVSGNAGWMARTVNGGATWTTYQLASVGELMDIDAVSATEYLAISSWGKLLRTTTSGVNGAAWSQINPVNGDNQYLNELSVGNATNAYAVARNGSAYRWNGATFNGVAEQPGRYANKMQVVATSATDPGTVTVSGEYGVVWRSTDSGATWTRQHATSGATMYASSAVNGSVMYMAGSNGDIVKTIDGGVTWTVSRTNASYPPQLGVDVDPGDGRIALSVGGTGTAFRTTNKGGAWSAVATGTTQNIHDVVFASSNVVWAVGQAGTILRSTNGGTTWSPQASGVTVALRSVFAVSEQRAWAVGDAGTIVATTNGGITWSTQASGTTQDLVSVAAASTTSAVVAGGDGVLRRTVNGGAAWVAPTTLPAGLRWESMLWLDGTTYVGMAVFGQVVRSTDAGDTWTQIADATSAAVQDADAVGRTLTYVSTYNYSKTSVDGGLTWSGADTASSWGAMAVAVVDGNSSYFVKDTTSIWETDESAVVASQISDYAGGATFGSGSATNTFGVCLQSLASATVDAPWVVDGGTCTAVDTDPWRGLSTTTMNVASAASGVTGTATFVWGARPRATQPSGTYTAGVTFEAIAPAA